MVRWGGVGWGKVRRALLCLVGERGGLGESEMMVAAGGGGGGGGDGGGREGGSACTGSGCISSIPPHPTLRHRKMMYRSASDPNKTELGALIN